MNEPQIPEEILEVQRQFTQNVNTFLSDLEHEISNTQSLEDGFDVRAWLAGRVLPVNKALMSSVVELLTLQSISFGIQQRMMYDELVEMISESGGETEGFVLDDDDVVNLVNAITWMVNHLKDDTPSALHAILANVMEPLVEYATEAGLIDPTEPPSMNIEPGTAETEAQPAQDAPGAQPNEEEVTDGTPTQDEQ